MIIYHKNKIIDLTKSEEPFTVLLTPADTQEFSKHEAGKAVCIYGEGKKELTNEEHKDTFVFQRSRIETHVEKTY